MNGNIGASSDVALARRLSRRLAGLPDGGGQDPADGGRFAKLPGDAEAPAPAASRTMQAVVGSAPSGVETWDAFLQWACEVATAPAAFVIDDQGFVIGSHGEVPPDGFEGTGAELSYAVGQASGINPEMGDLVLLRLAFERQGLAAVKVTAPEAGRFLLVLVEPLAADNALRQVAEDLAGRAGELR